MVDQLIIIGNGFDKQCGLPTNLSEYHEYRCRKNVKLVSLERQIKNIGNAYGAVEQVRNNTDLFEFYTIWDIIVFISSPNKYEIQWNQLESIINSWCEPRNGTQKSNIQLIINHMSNLDKDPLDIIVDYKLIAVWAKAIYAYKYINQEIDYFTFFLQELKKFENGFKNYLLEKTSDLQSSVTIKKTKLRDIIIGSQYSNIISFNYTIFDKEDKIDLVEYVHGNISSEIIIGIDSEKFMSTNDTYFFTKTSRKMFLYTEKNNKKINNVLDKHIDRIVFYGHSLNEQDYSYFQSIFDFYNIYNSNIDLVFYYSLYPEKPEKEIKSDVATSVTKLIEKYGDTFDNKHHGKNLLHKLLLEGRIKIKEISI